MTVSTLILVVLTGLVAGFLSGLMGVGGGTITIPALVIFAGVSQHMAQGISLAVIIPTAMIGAYGYMKKRNANIPIAFELAMGAVFGALIGAAAANSISGSDLKKIFGVFAIIIAIKVIKDVLSDKE